MKKINVMVIVPSIDDKFDIKLPINLKMEDAINLIQKTIFELSESNYIIKEKVVLCDCISGLVINSNNIVKFSGLKNGSSVILL